jgi:hypothetical protein
LRVLHKYIFGWTRHVTGILKKEKLRISFIIDELEALAEVRLLFMHETELKSQSNTKIANLLREEELKWYQRSLFLKDIRILDTSIMSLMVDIERNVFILYFRMRVRLKAMNNSSFIVLITIKICPENQREKTSL